jgi:hypothetical protein
MTLPTFFGGGKCDGFFLLPLGILTILAGGVANNAIHRCFYFVLRHLYLQFGDLVYRLAFFVIHDLDVDLGGFQFAAAK